MTSRLWAVASRSALSPLVSGYLNLRPVGIELTTIRTVSPTIRALTLEPSMYRVRSTCGSSMLEISISIKVAIGVGYQTSETASAATPASTSGVA